MSRNTNIISVSGYSLISSESGVLFSRSSTQTCDPEVKLPILLKKDIASKHILSKLSSFLL